MHDSRLKFWPVTNLMALSLRVGLNITDKDKDKAYDYRTEIWNGKLN